MPEHEPGRPNQDSWAAAEAEVRKSARKILRVYPQHRRDDRSLEVLAPDYEAFHQLAGREFSILAERYDLETVIAMIIESLASVACWVMDAAAEEEGITRDAILDDLEILQQMPNHPGTSKDVPESSPQSASAEDSGTA